MNQTGNVRDGLGFEVNLLHHQFGVKLVFVNPKTDHFNLEKPTT